MNDKFVSKAEPEVLELSEFLREFNRDSEKGAVLSAGAYLDQRLVEILNSFFVDSKESNELLLGFNAPIGTFSARIKATYSLGLIQQNEYEELNIIRKVRNEFAHSWKKVSFTDNKIKDLCGSLPWVGPEELEESSEPRARFTFLVSILLADLLWRVRLIQKERRIIKIWPNTSRLRNT